MTVKAKKKVEDGTIEEILGDITSYEDIESCLFVSTSKSGGATIMSYDGNLSYSRDTLKQALIDYGKFEREYFDTEYFDEYSRLDWA